MLFIVPRLRLLALWGLLASLTLALLPAVSHAIATSRIGARAAGAFEVCISTGSRIAATGGAPRSQGSHALLDDCALCPLAASAQAMPPPVMVAWLAALGSAETMAADGAAPPPHGPARWSPPTRAPPARS